MTMRSIGVTTAILLVACMSPNPPTRQWVDFVRKANEFSETQLESAKNDALKRHSRQATDENSLRLSYLLSRPNPSTQDLTKSRGLLKSIDASSVYAPLRDLTEREVSLIAELQSAQHHLTELRHQLNALKSIETDLTQDQLDLEARPQ